MNYSVAWRDFQQVLLPRFQGLKEKTLGTRLTYAWPKTWLKNTSYMTSLKHDSLQVFGTLTIAMPQVIYITQKCHQLTWVEPNGCRSCTVKWKKIEKTWLQPFLFSQHHINTWTWMGQGLGRDSFQSPPLLPQILPLVQVTQ